MKLFKFKLWRWRNDTTLKTDEKEFTFIWFKKISFKNNVTHYTAPFRTKIKAKSKEDAKQILVDLVMSKMTLEIAEEKDFNSSELMKFKKKFDELNKEFQDNLNKILKTK